ncbi:DUF5590 domain-containing protein [Ectobacillus panaciterrae]|uniref:cell wall elongation regulator TseB-like domain-containing protein n=1 Tax=Ectobacillus panaciterrae TaxID=363872 RepID=UPI000404286B|nr:DUF5590 domain-containing protein [Ectobacillus panaciterrae]
MKKLILTIVFAVIAVVLYSVYVYTDTMSGKLKGEEKAVAIAKKEAKLTAVTRTDYYHGYDEKSSYSVIEGKDDAGTQWIIWVPGTKGKVLTRKKSEGISEKEVLQIVAKQKNAKEFLKVKLGAENDVPLWEVTYIDQENRYNYCYLDFKNGEIWRNYSI